MLVTKTTPDQQMVSARCCVPMFTGKRGSAVAQW